MGGNAVAERFMKRVTLVDGAAGNALGWNPDGAETIFSISEPAVSGLTSAFITVQVRSTNTNFDCEATNQAFGTFTVNCTLAPPNDTELHYVVENLPPHTVL
jgi:hypothetical protein